MFRQIVAASAVALMTTGAIAQSDGVERAPAVDAIQPDVDRLRADFDARFADYDERMEDYDRQLLEVDQRLRALEERGVERAGTEAGEDVVDANQPEQDVVE